MLLFLISTYYSTKYLVIQVENCLLKLAKKWTLKTQKSQIAILVLNQCSISAVFPIVRFAGDQKTALTGESLYTLNWFFTTEVMIVKIVNSSFKLLSDGSSYLAVGGRRIFCLYVLFIWYLWPRKVNSSVYQMPIWCLPFMYILFALIALRISV